MRKFVIVCLGVEPKVFGPFGSVEEAERDIAKNITEEGGTCQNDITASDHHILELMPPEVE